MCRASVNERVHRVVLIFRQWIMFKLDDRLLSWKLRSNHLSNGISLGQKWVEMHSVVLSWYLNGSLSPLEWQVVISMGGYNCDYIATIIARDYLDKNGPIQLEFWANGKFEI